MIPYRQEKIQNAVAFFSERFLKKTKRPLPQTCLYKFLALLDFTSIKETGIPVLGLEYETMERGPVPIEIYNNKSETPKYKFQKRKFGDWDGEAVFPKGRPDLNYFSDYELDLMGRFIEIYAQAWVTTSIMSECSHEQILAWRRTYSKKKRRLINYALEFEGDIFSKTIEELTFPEEAYLTYKALSG